MIEYLKRGTKAEWQKEAARLERLLNVVAGPHEHHWTLEQIQQLEANLNQAIELSK